MRKNSGFSIIDVIIVGGIVALLLGMLFWSFNALKTAPGAAQATEVQASSIPQPTGFVNDFADIISPEVQAKLEADLSSYSHEIAVLTVTSMGGLSDAEYGIKLAEEWKVGASGKDDGVIFIVSTGDRRVRIEIGYGAEAWLNDAKAGRILDQVVVPQFKAENWEEGIVAGITAIKASFKQ